MKDGLPQNIADAFGTIKSPLQTGHPAGTVCVCMIVKDEADKIYSAIKSALLFADQIVINDTGSTDATLDIIKTFHANEGAKIQWYQTEWKDDFSAARNSTLEKSCCAWNLWLDADDVVSPEMAAQIKILKSAPLDRAFSFTIKNTNQFGLPEAEFMQIRMFPNHPLIYFERRIHEQSVYSIAKLGLYVVYTKIFLTHTGYDNPEKRKLKQIRNLRLMAQEDGAKSDYSLLMAQGDSHYILGNYKEGLNYFHSANKIENLDKINRDAYLTIPNRIANGYHLLNDYENARKWYIEAYKRFPDNIENVFQLGKVYETLENFEKAVECYNQVLKIPKLINSHVLRFDQCRLYAFHYATRLLMKMGRNRECLELLNVMRDLYPDYKLDSEGD